jgi:ATP-binding cassette subfamily C protein
VGVILIGALGALSIQGIESHQAGKKVSALLRLLGIQNFSFQNEVAILGIGAACCLILKTASSIYFTRKTLRFLSHKNTSLSNTLIEKVLSQDLLDIQKRSTQEILYILSDGVYNVFFGIIGSANSHLFDSFFISYKN